MITGRADQLLAILVAEAMLGYPAWCALATWRARRCPGVTLRDGSVSCRKLPM